MKRLILFDFDGTITTDDTLFSITKFSTSASAYYIKIIYLIPVFIAAKLNLLAKSRAKEIMLSLFFKNWSQSQFNKLCVSFCRQQLPKTIKDEALQLIEKYQTDSDIYIVSASPENWIKPWAQKFNIQVISTKLHFENNTFTGKIDGQNCNGEEKVKRIKIVISLDSYEEIIAYGDSKGDLPMLNLANQSYYQKLN